MAKDFEWNYEAAGEVFLKSEGIAAFCEEQAARMTRATGMEYKSDVFQGKTRVNARGIDSVKHEDGQYKDRGNGKVVYTQHRIRSEDE